MEDPLKSNSGDFPLYFDWRKEKKTTSRQIKYFLQDVFWPLNLPSRKKTGWNLIHKEGICQASNVIAAMSQRDQSGPDRSAS